MHSWLRRTIRQRDEEAIRIAEMNQTPVPPVSLPPSVARFKEMGESEFDVEVLARAHHFMSPHEAFTSDDEPVIALHVSQDDSDENLIRRLAHEFGHRRQKKNGDVFDRSIVEGYVACERSAENYGWALADAWGYGAHFQQDYKKEVEESLNDFESALYDLQASLEIHDAFALVSIGLQIIYLESPEVASLLKPLIGDRMSLDGWKGLDLILWSHPEYISGFDRFCLGSSWIVTRFGESSEFPIASPEIAASDLYILLQDSTYYAQRVGLLTRSLEVEPGEKTRQFVACFEGTRFGASMWIGLIHDLIVKFADYSISLDFWHATFDDITIIKADMRWVLNDDGQTVAWSLYWSSSGGEIFTLRGAKMLVGLHYFINTFHQRCGIYRKNGSDLWHDFVWLMGRDSTKLDIRKYISSKNIS